MPKVMPPDIHHTDSLAPSRPGPKNRVGCLAVALFDEIDSVDAGWRGEGALVLSLWTEDRLNSPIQYCLSPHGARILVQELRSALESQEIG